MKTKYKPSEVESKWQEKWRNQKLYASDLSKANKYYCLAEFPYPSGDLHMGHWFTWGGADIFARYKRMQGFQVFFPMGFDAFGLPAENAAIKNNIHPEEWTLSNVAKMKKQLETMGASFNFDHEVITCLPNYYRWNQWIFLKMLEKGLAYQGVYISNWCPSCQTVIANEGVENGTCWRCHSQVEQKEVQQWFFKITEYADRLIWPDQPTVDWPQSVKEGQNAWIGKSQGLEIDFKLKDTNEQLTVYTKFPETIFGVTYMVLAPEHTLVKKLVEEGLNVSVEILDSVKKYVGESAKKLEVERKAAERNKTGVFTGLYVINPVNNQQVPVWIADYVLANYGTGAVMGVPGSDHRDYAFAKTYSLPVSRVVGISANDDSQIESQEQVLEKGILVNSEQFSGLNTPDQARQKISEWLIAKGWAKAAVQYHIHDWSVSRQRYWGTPVPVIHCPKCGIVPVPEKELPVILPHDVDYTPHGKPPLASNEEWLHVKCPNCGGEAVRDAETLDTFVDSSWYFFRYLSPDLETGAFDIDLAKSMMPVDIYFGGAEHTLGHTLYSRFFTKFFKDLGLTDLDEYAMRRVNHGIVLGPDGTKMSKSVGNIVNPDLEVKKYGADAVRTFLAFFMPYDGTGPWISERIWGPYHFLERIWSLAEQLKDGQLSDQDSYRMHSTIDKVSKEIEAVKFNTAVAALMEWLNYLTAKDQIYQQEYQTILKLLAPFAPHITEELWEGLGNTSSIHNSDWPKVEEKHLIAEQINLPIQINGKVRDMISINSELINKTAEIEKLVLSSPKVNKFLDGQNPKKVIYIPGKIVNIVI